MIVHIARKSFKCCRGAYNLTTAEAVALILTIGILMTSIEIIVTKCRLESKILQELNLGKSCSIGVGGFVVAVAITIKKQQRIMCCTILNSSLNTTELSIVIRIDTRYGLKKLPV